MKEIMENLSQFKKRLAVGVKLHTVWHIAPNGINKDRGIREVSVVKRTGFALKTKQKDGSYKDSWCDYPAIGRISFTSNSITIMEPEHRSGNHVPILTYTFVE